MIFCHFSNPLRCGHFQIMGLFCEKCSAFVLSNLIRVGYFLQKIVEESKWLNGIFYSALRERDKAIHYEKKLTSIDASLNKKFVSWCRMQHSVTIRKTALTDVLI